MEEYYKQLVEGCGTPSCRHPLCAGNSEYADGLGCNGITERSAKLLAYKLEKMVNNYTCRNLSSNLPRLELEHSLESLTKFYNSTSKDTTYPYPVVITSSNENGLLVHRLKELDLNLPILRGEGFRSISNITSHNKENVTRDMGEFLSLSSSRLSSEVFESSQLNRKRVLNTLRSYIDLKIIESPTISSAISINKVDRNSSSTRPNSKSYACGLDSPMSCTLPCNKNSVRTAPSNNIYNSELPSQQEKYFGLPFLDLELIESLVRKHSEDDNNQIYTFESQSDREFLARSVNYVFGNTVPLCSSFLIVSSPVHINECSGIDYKLLNKAYKILNSLTPHELFRDKILFYSEQLLIEGIFNLHSINNDDPRYLRKYIIILENDYIWANSTASRFGRFISRIFSAIGKHNKKLLSRWFYNTPSEQLEKYIKIFNDCVTRDFQPNSDKAIKYVRDPLKVLRLLFDVNKHRKKHFNKYNVNNTISISTEHSSHSELPNRGAVPISLFYNLAISNDLDYKKQYRLLMNSKEDRAAYSDDSILKYTFLLNPLGKTRLMRIDAVFKMLQKYGNAFINIEIVNRTCRLFESQFFELNVPVGLNDEITPFLILEVRRDNIVEDTIRQLFSKLGSLKKPLKVKFIDSGEVGVDQGGIQKEFFQIIVDKFLDPVHGMFTYDKEARVSWINGSSLERLSSFEAFGIIQGLSLYNGAILRLNFPKAIYKKLLGDSMDISDLESVSPTVGKSLRELLSYELDDFEDTFLLDFTLSYEALGVVEEIQLVKNGKNIPVTKENRSKYVSLVINHMLIERCKRQFEAYKSGFYKVLNKDIVTIASHDELELMICGVEPANMDFTELKNNTIYSSGYTSNSTVIKWFWQILLTELSLEQKMSFLTFCTASDRIPLGGLRMLKFTISRNGPDTNRLPTSMTCFSILMLPEYGSIEKLRSCLLTAIQCSSGFGLV